MPAFVRWKIANDIGSHSEFDVLGVANHLGATAATGPDTLSKGL